MKKDRPATPFDNDISAFTGCAMGANIKILGKTTGILVITMLITNKYLVILKIGFA